MDWLAIGNHLLNFAAPAIFVGWLLALAGVMFPVGSHGSGAAPIGRLRRSWQAGWINTFAGVVASATVLGMLGRDGEIVSYAALVLSAASSQWLMMRGWRR